MSRELKVCLIKNLFNGVEELGYMMVKRLKAIVILWSSGESREGGRKTLN